MLKKKSSDFLYILKYICVWTFCYKINLMTVYTHYLTSVYSFCDIFSSVICLQQKACGLEVSLAVTVAPGPGTAPTAERGRASSCRDGKGPMWADTRGHVTRVGASRAPDRILRALWHHLIRYRQTLWARAASALPSQTGRLRHREGKAGAGPVVCVLPAHRWRGHRPPRWSLGDSGAFPPWKYLCTEAFWSRRGLGYVEIAQTGSTKLPHTTA